MDFYHWWIYENVFNTTWFMWTFVILIFGVNIFSFVIIWMIMNGRSLSFLKGNKGKKKGKKKKGKKEKQKKDKQEKTKNQA
ncbi:hypothetical protein RZN22_11925 [Bacillaceae bacterium S4-13-58]